MKGIGWVNLWEHIKDVLLNIKEILSNIKEGLPVVISYAKPVEVLLKRT